VLVARIEVLQPFAPALVSMPPQTPQNPESLGIGVGLGRHVAAIDDAFCHLAGDGAAMDGMSALSENGGNGSKETYDEV
jgi:hypothetical protein